MDYFKLMPQHKQARAAKKIDVIMRLAEITRTVYLDAGQDTAENRAYMDAATSEEPAQDGRQIFFGELHGHTFLSDGHLEPEEYFAKMRQRFDFCALTDHDHGGLWKDTLYTEKWKRLQELVASCYEPGVFTTLLAYERDSYPWYDNMCVYFRDQKSDILECAVRGETTAEELEQWLAREDLFIAPHDMNRLTCSTDFTNRPSSLMPHGLEIYSRGDCAEYFDHPLNVLSSVRGGSLQEALAAGAHLAVYAGSDDHYGMNGLDLPEKGFPERYPGMTGVWAKENTVEGIFEALRGRHTYGFMGPERIVVDFRVNDQRMGSVITEPVESPHRKIYFSVESKIAPKKITVVKNNRDYYVSRKESNDSCVFIDYERQHLEDWYYLRVELEDGRMAWTSPCWVKASAV